MPLTHVCMWTEKGWKRVTAQEAGRIHPGGSVSSKSGLFMCDLCGQYVTLTNGSIRERYFKHSKEEESKDCPERTFGLAASSTFQAGAHELPIRIKIISQNRFGLEMGFLGVPKSLLGKRDSQQIKVMPIGSNANSFVYSFTRLNQEGITYLSIGERPVALYKIATNSTNKELKNYWPESVEGIKQGALFDKKTRKKLPTDADVQIGKEYYLLTKNRLYGYGSHIMATQVCSMNFSWETWRVYEIIADAFNEETARFFLDYHCRLTEYPVKLYPLWPIYVESPYLILHKDNDMKMFFQGDANPKLFPIKSINKRISGNASILYFQSSERQQMISAGRSKVLKYIYLWKSELDYVAQEPIVKVEDIENNIINSGEQKSLPKNNILSVVAPMDGEIILKKGNEIVDKYKLMSNHKVVIDEIYYGMTVEILQGLDCVWQVQYLKEEKSKTKEEKEILQNLRKAKGKLIPVPHTIGSLANKMETYPEIRNWLYKKIRSGYIEEKALLFLKKKL